MWPLSYASVQDNPSITTASALTGCILGCALFAILAAPAIMQAAALPTAWSCIFIVAGTMASLAIGGCITTAIVLSVYNCCFPRAVTNEALTLPLTVHDHSAFNPYGAHQPPNHITANGQTAELAVRQVFSDSSTTYDSSGDSNAAIYDDSSRDSSRQDGSPITVQYAHLTRPANVYVSFNDRGSDSEGEYPDTSGIKKPKSNGPSKPR